jgi:phospholipid-binding lipoprotein MlaA
VEGSKRVTRWMVAVGLAIGGGGLMGCAAGLDSFSALDTALAPPQLTASVGGGEEHPIQADASALTAADLPAPVEAAAPAPEAPAAEAAPAEMTAAPAEPLPVAEAAASLEVAQATPEKSLEAVKEENYDPFATAEEKAGPIDEYDPWEPFNVKMFQFNRKLDEWVLRPVAKVYDKVVPDPLERGISNAFHNIRTVPRILSNLFQGKFKGAGIETSRFLLNSTFGVAGFMDFAGENFDLVTPDEDFGQTLGVYGTKPGPYLVIPILGSFTVRDGTGYIVDLFLDPFNLLLFPFFNVQGWPQVVTNEDTVTFAQLGIRAGYIVNERSLNIDTTFEGVEESVVDLYGAVRNAYLQKRAKAIRE